MKKHDSASTSTGKKIMQNNANNARIMQNNEKNMLVLALALAKK